MTVPLYTGWSKNVTKSHIVVIFGISKIVVFLTSVQSKST